MQTETASPESNSILPVNERHNGNVARLPKALRDKVIRHPDSGIQCPPSSAQHPESVIQHPELHRFCTKNPALQVSNSCPEKISANSLTKWYGSPKTAK